MVGFAAMYNQAALIRNSSQTTFSQRVQETEAERQELHRMREDLFRAQQRMQRILEDQRAAMIEMQELRTRVIMHEDTLFASSESESENEEEDSCCQNACAVL